MEILVRQNVEMLEAVKDDEVEILQLQPKEVLDRKGDQGQFVDRCRITLRRRTQNGEMNEADGRIGFQQVAPGALTGRGLARYQQDLEAVADAVDGDDRRVVDPGD